MRLHQWRLTAKLMLLLIAPMVLDIAATTTADLRRDEKLTPEAFAAQFVKFKFRFRAEVQSWDQFLKSRSGDCDDFATLAAEILRERGYTTKLLSIRMNGVNHVVCYVKEAGGYLDYNYRKLGRILPCADDPTEIAARVAEYYHRPWNSVAEFTYADGLKRLVATVRAPDRIGPNVAATETASVQLISAVSGSQQH